MAHLTRGLRLDEAETPIFEGIVVNLLYTTNKIPPRGPWVLEGRKPGEVRSVTTGLGAPVSLRV